MSGALKSITKMVGGLFGGGETPGMVMPTPEVPTQKTGEVRDAGIAERDRLRQGMAATMLTGSDGVVDDKTKIKKARLLGQ